MKIIILNLPRDLSEEHLGQLFKNYGSVLACNLVLDATTGISKGFGFVEMDIKTEAEAAITALNGSKIKHNKIRVKNAG